MRFGASWNTSAQRVLILIFLRNNFWLWSPNSEISPIYATLRTLANGTPRNATNAVALSVAIGLVGYASTTQCYFHLALELWRAGYVRRYLLILNIANR